MRYALAYGVIGAYRGHHPDTASGDLLATIQTDWAWRLPALLLADAHARHGRARTHMYEFA